MERIGNLFFKTRNFLFPVFYAILFLPFPRISENYLAMFIIGLVITTLGQLVRMITIGLVYIVRGGKNRRIYADGLVTDGIFSHSRNPMYIGNVLMIAGMSILSNSIFALVIMVPLFVFIYQAIIIAEENYLRTKFGRGYDEYCKKVNRWWPNLKGIVKTCKDNGFDVQKVLMNEYNTTFLWTFGSILLFAYNYYWNRFSEISIEDSTYFLVIAAILIIVYFALRWYKKRMTQSLKLRL